MNVLLVQPQVCAEPMYPVPLAAMAAMLRARGHAVWGVDLQFDSVATLYDRLQEVEADWVGATVLPHNAEEVGKLFRDLRTIRPISTFIAGAYPTLDAKAALLRTGADVAVVGDPETTVADLVDRGLPGPIPGAVARTEHGPVAGPRRQPTPLADLPFPDRSLFPPIRYSYAMRSTAVPYTMAYTSRGCHLACPWCAVPTLRPRGFNCRPAEQVHAEMKMLAEDFGIRSVHIEDDAFLADRQRIMDLCRLLQERPLAVVWELVNGVRPDQLDPELVTAMAGAGCSRMVLSLEHLTAGKAGPVGYEMTVAREAVRMARAAGMRVGGYFMVGLPGVSLAESLASIYRGLALRLDDANFIALYDAPGSAYAEQDQAPRLPPATSAQLARAAQLAFFCGPRPLLRLTIDLIRTPQVIPSLADKARELIRFGGPVPMRDTL